MLIALDHLKIEGLLLEYALSNYELFEAKRRLRRCKGELRAVLSSSFIKVKSLNI